jgi:hypothetical protein
MNLNTSFLPINFVVAAYQFKISAINEYTRIVTTVTIP